MDITSTTRSHEGVHDPMGFSSDSCIRTPFEQHYPVGEGYLAISSRARPLGVFYLLIHPNSSQPAMWASSHLIGATRPYFFFRLANPSQHNDRFRSGCVGLE